MQKEFFSPQHTSLKICGVTQASDAERLVEYGVDAIGINFWPQSKRYCTPELAKSFAPGIQGKILRVGVFVNASEEDVLKCFSDNLIDVAQFHGDETLESLSSFSRHQHCFIRAIGLKSDGSLPDAEPEITKHLLLDAHAPGVYGGTGKVVNWDSARNFVQSHPECAVMLAGGITPSNAAVAIQKVLPCGIDVASGAESSPGIKDFDKVQRLLEITRLR